MSVSTIRVPGYIAAAEHMGGGGGPNGPLLNQSMPENDYQDVVGLRRGWGATFRGKAGREVWFHFAIPSPVGASGQVSTTVQVAFLSWSVASGARLIAVHLHDGNLPRVDPMVGSPPHGLWDPINVIGDHSTDAIEAVSRFTLPTPAPVRFGLGVSALVHFDQDADVFFASAGATFNIL